MAIVETLAPMRGETVLVAGVAGGVGTIADLAALLREVANAPFSSSLQDGVCHVKAAFLGHVLVGERDAKTRAILTDTVDGRSPSAGLFSVNGFTYQ
ncbi:MAG: hypothetical protein ACLPYS_11680 [Vulcanimicrobiaceae bacterium]